MSTPRATHVAFIFPFRETARNSPKNILATVVVQRLVGGEEAVRKQITTSQDPTEVLEDSGFALLSGFTPAGRPGDAYRVAFAAKVGA